MCQKEKKERKRKEGRKRDSDKRESARTLREIRNYDATYIHSSTRVSESVSRAEIMGPASAPALI
jgi:hypothetical protein